MKIVQPALIETVTHKDIMAVKIPKELLTLAEEDWSFFLDLKQMKSLKIKTLDLKTLLKNKELRKYSYYTGPKDVLAEHPTMPEDKEDDFWEKTISADSLKTIKRADFDTQNLFYFWGDAGLWYSFRGETPLSPYYYIDYIGGVADNYYDLDKAEKILKKNPYVSKIKKIDIPYYNAEANFTKAIEFYVKLPQEDHDKLVKYYRDELKEEFWMVRVKECLASSHSLKPFDILGLKKALKSKNI